MDFIQISGLFFTFFFFMLAGIVIYLAVREVLAKDEGNWYPFEWVIATAFTSFMCYLGTYSLGVAMGWWTP